MIIETFRQAIQNVWSNKLRTFLTMLGIIIGVMAVIVIVGLGNGMTKSMRDSFSALGTNTLSVQVWGNGSRTVPVEEMYKLPTKYPELIQSISPQIDFSGSGTLKIGTNSYRWSNISGVDENYSVMKNYQIAQGRGLQYMDIKDNKQVCVIGDYLAQAAFRGDALGKTISLSGVPYTVIGVLSKSGDSSEGSADDVIYIPYENAQRMGTGTMMMGTDEMFLLTSTSRDTASAAKGIVEKRLYKTYQSSDYYMVMTSAEMMDAMNTMMNTMLIVLVAIAAISLVVGGIGIMNIMLVSVTERTREIGIRKSLGAKQKDIRGQFVIEAGTTSAVGGVLGIVFGLLLARAATIAVGAIMSSSMNGITFSAVPTLSDIAVSFGVSVGIGVLFGYLPANKAAKLNPIDALRYD